MHLTCQPASQLMLIQVKELTKVLKVSFLPFKHNFYCWFAALEAMAQKGQISMTNLLYWTSSIDVAVHSSPSHSQNWTTDFRSRIQTLAIRLVKKGCCQGDIGDSNFCILQSNTMSLLETHSHILGLIRFYAVE